MKKTEKQGGKMSENDESKANKDQTKKIKDGTDKITEKTKIINKKTRIINAEIPVAYPYTRLSGLEDSPLVGHGYIVDVHRADGPTHHYVSSVNFVKMV